MSSVLLIRFAEIYLKGMNRPFFERQLIANIKHALEGTGAKVDRMQGRVYVRDYVDEADAVARVSRVFGVHSLSPALRVEKDIAVIERTAADMLTADGVTSGSFKVNARRADKTFPLNSPAVSARVGGYILSRIPTLCVDVHKPDREVEVEIREDAAYVLCSTIPAVGGMPTGTNGRALLLLSGGIDSPAAGYMIAKRGVTLDAIHFFSYPYTSDRAKEKVVRLAQILSRYCGTIHLHVIPFTKIQEEIAARGPESQSTILTRRYMMRISERVARQSKCSALVTGESIGQVASQTMESLTVTDDAVHMPVFRPFIGSDKLEIIDVAQKIGTFDTSVLPYEDCCTVFTPRHPVTHPRLPDIVASEQKLALDDEVEKAIRDREILTIGS
ncbi:MAG: tRNA 4-thiouridine(8) synthase ThiI [Eubacteriales bacterium]|nr:tRNA 4-thiouridine(8) synthase ThiI [Eubacteriales bacterium]